MVMHFQVNSSKVIKLILVAYGGNPVDSSPFKETSPQILHIVENPIVLNFNYEKKIHR